MFIGHYGVSFALKSISPKIPVWILFSAVQFVDILWSVLVIVGIEKVRIVVGITASNPLDLYYMPYTHSLLAVIIWSLASLFVYRLLPNVEGMREALLIATAILSHWFLDLLVHRPDLPLYNDTYKVGFGLWNYPKISFLLEAGLLLAGVILYLRSTVANTILGKYGIVVLGLVMIAIQAVLFFGSPLTHSSTETALIALVLYIIFAGVAHWLSTQRTNLSTTISTSQHTP
jgi:hypothetical protein